MLDLLGSGAMGVVFAAYDPELDRRVALKLLRERTGDDKRNARMVREARATARLAPPNVVVVHDVGDFEDNVFMAMELVVGGTLGDWLGDRERSSRDAILSVFLEAGEGLVAAHAAGLVHRDFKPANVLMGDDGRARVTDFGLARAGESTDAPTHHDFVTLRAVDLLPPERLHSDMGRRVRADPPAIERIEIQAPYASALPRSAPVHTRPPARCATTALAGGPPYSSAPAFSHFISLKRR